MKYYILQEKGSEYNDSTYDMSDWGKPMQVFTNKAEAQLKADRLNHKRFTEDTPMQYGDYNGDVFTDIHRFIYDLNNMLGTNCTVDDIDWQWKLPKMTFEQYQKIKHYFQIEFYFVDECSSFAPSNIRGLHFCLTGILPNMTREVAVEKIEAAGGIVHSSLTHATDYLVAGVRPGEKYTQAENDNITIINEADLLRILGE